MSIVHRSSTFDSKPKVRQHRSGKYYCYDEASDNIGSGESMPAAYLAFLRIRDRKIIRAIEAKEEEERIVEVIRQYETGKSYVVEVKEDTNQLCDRPVNKRWWQI